MRGWLRRAGRRRRRVVSYSPEDAYRRCYETVLRIHHAVIVRSGEERERGLEDRVINPMAVEGLCDRLEYCEDCFSKAALAIDYVVNFHPFMEGNKRTAFELAVALLQKGGYCLDDDMETFVFIKEVAQGLHDREEVEKWLRRNSHVSTS